MLPLYTIYTIHPSLRSRWHGSFLLPAQILCESSSWGHNTYKGRLEKTERYLCTNRCDGLAATGFRLGWWIGEVCDERNLEFDGDNVVNQDAWR